MDLHVVEPSGERAYYRHKLTTIGGLLSRDFTNGYGPEVYMLRHAMPGTYRIEADYYGSTSARLVGAVTLRVDLFTHFGRPDEHRESLTFRLSGKKDRIAVGEIQF
jgi:Ca-activated chloride channel family protein